MDMRNSKRSMLTEVRRLEALLRAKDAEVREQRSQILGARNEYAALSNRTNMLQRLHDAGPKPVEPNELIQSYELGAGTAFLAGMFSAAIVSAAARYWWPF